MASKYDVILDGTPAKRQEPIREGQSYWQRKMDRVARDEAAHDERQLRAAESNLNEAKRRLAELKSPVEDPFPNGGFILAFYRPDHEGSYPEYRTYHKDDEGIWWIGPGDPATWRRVLKHIRSDAQQGREIRVINGWTVVPGGDQFDQVGDPVVNVPNTAPKRAYVRKAPAKKAVAKKTAAKRV